jgi:ParB-like chromosome segregation protein Spo0J
MAKKTSKPIVAGSQLVALDSVKPHPNNARLSDTLTLMESLDKHGQYRPIVVQKSTKYILAGNHTWDAARRLNWQEVAVTFVDVDDETAKRIMLVDNRTSDLATYDDHQLLALLHEVSDLTATGFDGFDLEVLDAQMAEDSTLDDNVGGESADSQPKKPKMAVQIGPFAIDIDEEVFKPWEENFADSRKYTVAMRDLQDRLLMQGLVNVTKPVSTDKHSSETELVDVDELSPLTGNARQGDVGAISESLAEFGQFRPIVVNRQDKSILVGNHTWAAAKALGWKQIGVTWVDVSREQALQIALVDNRSADLSSYDDQMLAALLVEVDTQGTGFGPADVDDLLHDIASGRSHRRPAKNSKVRCRVGKWSWTLNKNNWVDWLARVEPLWIELSPLEWIAERLELPEQWRGEE